MSATVPPAADPAWVARGAFLVRRRASAGYKAARAVVHACQELLDQLDQYIDHHGDGCPCAFCAEAEDLSIGSNGAELYQDFLTLAGVVGTYMNLAESVAGHDDPDAEEEADAPAAVVTG